MLDREASGAKEDGAGLRGGRRSGPKQSKQDVEKVGLLGRRGEVMPEGIRIRREVGALGGGGGKVVEEIEGVLWLEERFV